jgi:hypothetical protein
MYNDVQVRTKKKKGKKGKRQSVVSGTKKHVGDCWEENNCQEQYVPELAIPTVLNAPFNGGAVQYQCRTVRVHHDRFQDMVVPYNAVHFVLFPSGNCVDFGDQKRHHIRQRGSGVALHQLTHLMKCKRG